MSKSDTRADYPPLQPKDIIRFWSKVDKSPGQGPKGECWEWKGQSHKGYGKFFYWIKPHAYRVLTHRVSFFLQHGRWPVPCGCHSCDNPPCCNPVHIWEGTRTENNADCKTKARLARGLRVGSAKLSSEQVIEIKRLRLAGWKNQEIAMRFKVSYLTVSNICRGVARSDVADDTGLSPEAFRHEIRVRGERNSHTKLTEAGVLQALAWRAEGMSHRQVADRLSVSASAIKLIVQGRNWSYLTGISNPDKSR